MATTCPATVTAAATNTLRFSSLSRKHYIPPGAKSSPASSQKSQKLSPGKSEEVLKTPSPKAKLTAEAKSTSAPKKLERARRLRSTSEPASNCKARVKKSIAKAKASKKAFRGKIGKGKAKDTSGSKKSATPPDRRIRAKQSAEEESEKPDEPEKTEAFIMSDRIAEALKKLGTGDRSGNKCSVLVEDEDAKQKRKNKKNSFYRSLMSHLIAVYTRS